MLPEQKDLMYKHFPQLVEKCDLEHILHELIEKDELSKEILNEISLEDNLRHNNRCILFKLINLEQFNAFPGFVEALKQNGFNELVSSLENNYKRITKDNQLHPLDVNIDVKLSTQFYDTNEYNRTGFYTTRSKNRGHVLLVNNIKFPAGNEERHGAETDQENLRTLFEKMGLTVFSFTNLSAYEMYFKTQEFSKNVPETKPDMAIVIFMSHGLMYQNETMIISSDNKMLTEDSFRTIFNNENCALFRGKPKIFIYHICRAVLENPMRETMTDANRSDTQRTYSDMLICHPSVKGYSAYRNSIKGSWYIQLLCKVFMEHAHDMDVESLLKKVDEELEIVSSMPWQLDEGHSTQQTSTFQNIAFKKCYIHPGLYEEDGKVKHFSQT